MFDTSVASHVLGIKINNKSRRNEVTDSNYHQACSTMATEQGKELELAKALPWVVILFLLYGE